ncbi:MAG TPA: citrate synthase [Candidatus Thermoplasmatota archaeon]|nr:citrate synthase [Candidatus Thermoplasmatota archaeon]
MTGKGGLEGVVVGKTEISTIDGLAGRLWYRGIDIWDLAKHSTFEETAYLLWHGVLPTKAQLEALTKELQAEYNVPEEALATLRPLAKRENPMSFLRTAVSVLAAFDPEAEASTPEANLRKSIRLTAKLPTVIAFYGRVNAGQEPVKPDQSLNIASNFLYMLQGKVPDKEICRDFDVALVLHADHHFNASTFSARVTASTLSDLHSAITSAVGTLKGPLHGGANTEVMQMLEEIGSKENVEPYILGKLERKEKIMGFGHRVYKTVDPRSVVLKEVAERLGSRKGNLKFFEMNTVAQRVMKEKKNLDPNVDFYSAVCYNLMGINKDLFTPIFALSRVTGWTAHCMEQWKDNRLIRPDAEYVGPTNVAYVPIEQRK